MSYIGNTPTSQAFAPGTDTFSGTGSQTAFTLSRNVATVNDILVAVNNVDQQPTAYTVAGATLTFSAAPSSGTNNIYVRYLSTNLQTIAPQQGSVYPSSLSTGGPYWDTSGNVGVGTTSPVSSLTFGNSKVLTWLNAAGNYNGTTLGTQILKFSDNSTYFDYLDSGSSLIFRRNNNAESGRFDNSGNLWFNSGYGSSAVAYGCRAWVNFNGTGTVAIRASGNVTSITDNGVGSYTVNFTSAFPDINYCPTAVVGASGQLAQIWDGASTKTISAYLFNTMFANSLTGGGGVVDPVNVQIAFFR